MLWLTVYLPKLPLEALSPPEAVPVAVIETHGPRRTIAFVSSAAEQQSVVPDMSATAAQALVPQIQLLTRNLEQERAALESVACWLYGFGRPVAIDAASLSVHAEIGASLRLMGGGAGLWRRLIGREDELPYARQYGVAPTQAAGLILAKASAGFRGAIVRQPEIGSRLAKMPLTVLPLNDRERSVLLGSGFRTVGEVLAVPAAALGRRFGPDIATMLHRLVGRLPERFTSFEPSTTYRRRVEFSGGIETTEALLFPLRPMLAEFCTYLRSRDVTAQRFVLTFVDIGRRRTELPVALMAPTRDPARLMLVLMEKLAKVALTEPVLELILAADRFEPAAAISDDLFDRTAGDGERLAALQERLVARLGEDAVRRVWVLPDHRPQRSWGQTPSEVPAEHPSRPLWLLPTPERIAPPTLLGPPERIESGWWEAGMQRDYFIAEDPRGRKLWVYRDAADEQWWLHGLWQ